ncbi:MAG: DUF72 domain-containing protein [Candidatus Doudnabacteria bacterium]
MKAYIGTSGWQYGHWRERFYPKHVKQKEWLKFFSKRFNTVEINNSFYRMPPKENFLRWAGEVKDNKEFLFSIKLYRLFTHYKRLKLGSEELIVLENFLKDVSALGKARGPILIQLPPSMKCDIERLATFIKQIKKIQSKFSRVNKYALEFRHVSWFNEEIYSLLRKEKIALVAGDSPRWPMRLLKTADFLYLRLHGSQKLYASEYTERELREWYEAIKDLKAKEVFVYFDNDNSAFAVKNAKYMQTLA